MKSIAVLASVLYLGIGASSMALADEHDTQHKEEHKHHHKGHHDKDDHNCPHHKGKMGKHHEHKGWRKSLSEEQKNKLKTLREQFYKEKQALMQDLKTNRVELAKLYTQDSPDQQAIDNKIDAILKLKGQKIRLRVKHKIAVRAILTDEQKKKFDEFAIKKAEKGKRHCRHHH